MMAGVRKKTRLGFTEPSERAGRQVRTSKLNTTDEVQQSPMSLPQLDNRRRRSAPNQRHSVDNSGRRSLHLVSWREFWSYGVLGFRTYGVMGFRSYGVMGFWGS